MDEREDHGMPTWCESCNHGTMYNPCDICGCPTEPPPNEERPD